MAMLMGQSCCVLVAQALLVDFKCVEMSEYCDCYGKWVWPSGEPEDWKET
jgi:hypothetical protein